jgi:hydroxymethylglutaryl-CoA lyase
MPAQTPIEIVEVAPRDGFQSIDKPIETGIKIGIIEGLIAAGLTRVEFGSFVSPRAIPQMADMADIAQHFKNETRARLSVLVPNVKGAELALKNDVKEIVYVFSASEAHNQSNVSAPIAKSIQGLSDVCDAIAGADDVTLRVDIATAFDCPFDGTVPLNDVLHAIREVAARAPSAEIALCDTTGKANPFDVAHRFEQAMAVDVAKGNTWAFHGHDTYGMGIANALAANSAGVGVFDTSAGGLGGCPFAPGATGNTATEDLVFAAKGAYGGSAVDLSALIQIADTIAALPGTAMGGHLRSVPRNKLP